VAELSLGGLADAGIDACDAGWLAVLAPGDRLEPQSLALVALHLGEHPETDLLYSDEDKQDTASGLRWDPFFKPDWSPDLILSIDYLGPLTFIRRSLLKQVGGLAAAPPGAETYDLALRATEVTEAIAHLPHVLVSRPQTSNTPQTGAWRTSPRGPPCVPPSSAETWTPALSRDCSHRQGGSAMPSATRRR
jgi:hypothetical protein